jgi:hypothetical protein
MYVKDQGQSKYTVKLNTTDKDGKRTSRDIEFSNVEMERIYKLYSMYQEPNTQVIKAETEKEIQNLTKIKRPRNYIFDDGVVFGTIQSYDPATKTYVVKDSRTGEETTKSGVIHHTAKSYVGHVQQIMDDIMNSNGNIAKLFTSTTGKVGFVTDKDKSGTAAYKGYKFMNLLGSKAAPVVKSFDNEGNVKEFYQDVIDILESLFNFAGKGELPSSKLTYLDNENTIHTTEVKFRVPVPLSSTNENGGLEYDYSNTPQNSSRDTGITNSRFFESNFENLTPSRVFVEFGKQTEEQAPEEVTETEEEKPQQTVSQFADRIQKGESMTDPEDLQFYENNKKEIEEELSKRMKAGEVKDVKNLTKEEINELSFNDIRMRLSGDQVKALDAYAKKEGFENIDHFFAMAESSHPEEQGLFRDYIIECLL